jgi:hypothetical protein
MDDHHARRRRQPSAWWDIGGARTGTTSAGTASEVTDFEQGNDYVGVAVASTLSRPADAWWAPVETVSNSESGFERVYQGSGLLSRGQSRCRGRFDHGPHPPRRHERPRTGPPGRDELGAG